MSMTGDVGEQLKRREGTEDAPDEAGLRRRVVFGVCVCGWVSVTRGGFVGSSGLK